MMMTNEDFMHWIFAAEKESDEYNQDDQTYHNENEKQNAPDQETGN